MKYLLDTDIIIYWMKGSEKIEEKAIAIGLENIFFSIISEAELYFGAYNSNYINENIKNIQILSKMLIILPFDSAAAKIFGKIKSRLKQAGNIILDADIMIASIALANNITLVSNNTKHFERIPELKFENWV